MSDSLAPASRADSAQAVVEPVSEPVAARAGQAPRVWLLLGPKPGDNNQVLALAEALGWPTTEKHLRYHRGELLSNRFLGPNLVGLSNVDATDLSAPWPDLVISAGRRNEPVARWIRRQARREQARSNNTRRVQLVHLGRPWAALRHFDLVISTPQYQLPHSSKVLHISLPLHRINAERLAPHAERWRERLNTLPAPYTVLLVGGSSANLVLDHHTAARLLEQAQQQVEASGGSLLISTSKRTPTAAIDALRGSLRVPGSLYTWQAGDHDNPYLAYLGLGDRFIVTGESVSMLTEACATGQPVSIFCPGKGADAGNPAPQAPQRNARQRFNHFSNRHAPRRWRRDITAIHQHLISNGLASWLGSPPPATPSTPGQQDLQRAVARIQQLLKASS